MREVTICYGMTGAPSLLGKLCCAHIFCVGQSLLGITGLNLSPRLAPASPTAAPETSPVSFMTGRLGEARCRLGTLSTAAAALLQGWPGLGAPWCSAWLCVPPLCRLSLLVCADPVDRRVATVGMVGPHLQARVADPATGRTLPRGQVRRGGQGRACALLADPHGHGGLSVRSPRLDAAFWKQVA